MEADGLAENYQVLEELGRKSSSQYQICKPQC